MDDVRETLMLAREAAGINQADLARHLGITRQFLRDIEIGKRPFPTARLKDLPDEIRDVVIEAAIRDKKRAHARELKELARS